MDVNIIVIIKDVSAQGRLNLSMLRDVLAYVPIFICFHVTINVTREWCPYSQSCKLSGYPDGRTLA